jgi:hypothetical protein
MLIPSSKIEDEKLGGVSSEVAHTTRD